MDLHKKIRKKTHMELAYAQDIVVEKIYDYLPEVVLHGGTLIWRCYAGNRFSEDLDFYAASRLGIQGFFDDLKPLGFVIEKLRIKENSGYIKLLHARSELKVEFLFKKVQASTLFYETVEGRRVMVRGLTPESVIMEKVEAYISRKKARDLYDIVHMLGIAKKTQEVKGRLAALIESFRPPLDFSELKSTVLTGYVPTPDEMLELIIGWARN